MDTAKRKFHVTRQDVGFFGQTTDVWARDREEAKRCARPILKGDPERYIVEPYSEHGKVIPSDPTPLQKLIERCRRQQQQKPGQLEMLSEREEQLMAVNHDMTHFMLDVRNVDRTEITEREGYTRDEWERMAWATEEEALEEWRSRTLEDWGFGRWYDEDVAVV